MAKKKTNGKSGSAHIREYLVENPEAAPSAIVEALATKGVTVSVGLVSNVKSTSQKGRKKKVARKKVGRGRTAGKKAASSQGGRELTADDLRAAKALVAQVGSFADARRALEALEELQ